MRSILVAILVIALLSFAGCTAVTKTPTIDEVTMTLVPLVIVAIAVYELGYRCGRKDGS